MHCCASIPLLKLNKQWVTTRQQLVRVTFQGVVHRVVQIIRLRDRTNYLFDENSRLIVTGGGGCFFLQTQKSNYARNNIWAWITAYFFEMRSATRFGQKCWRWVVAAVVSISATLSRNSVRKRRQQLETGPGQTFWVLGWLPLGKIFLGKMGWRWWFEKYNPWLLFVWYSFLAQEGIFEIGHCVLLGWKCFVEGCHCGFSFSRFVWCRQVENRVGPNLLVLKWLPLGKIFWLGQLIFFLPHQLGPLCFQAVGALQSGWNRCWSGNIQQSIFAQKQLQQWPISKIPSWAKSCKYFGCMSWGSYFWNWPAVVLEQKWVLLISADLRGWVENSVGPSWWGKKSLMKVSSAHIRSRNEDNCRHQVHAKVLWSWRCRENKPHPNIRANCWCEGQTLLRHHNSQNSKYFQNRVVGQDHSIEWFLWWIWSYVLRTPQWCQKEANLRPLFFHTNKAKSIGQICTYTQMLQRLVQAHVGE